MRLHLFISIVLFAGLACTQPDAGEEPLTRALPSGTGTSPEGTVVPGRSALPGTGGATRGASGAADIDAGAGAMDTDGSNGSGTQAGPDSSGIQHSDGAPGSSSDAGGGPIVRTEDTQLAPSSDTSEPVVASLSYCAQVCSTSLDCDMDAFEGGAFGPDNYSCEAGGCVYSGCNTNAECAITFQYSDMQMVCDDLGYGMEACVIACTQPSDCISEGEGTNGAFGADNYTCSDGACTYTGCNQNAECDATFGVEGEYVCTDGGGDFLTCQMACSTPSDCAVETDPAGGMMGTDNYECVDGVCRWLGCHSTAECGATFAAVDTPYICIEP